jgi:class 3 adenylate cyclase
MYAVVRMFCVGSAAMLATMSQHAEMPPLTWSELGLTELLPTGTVTLLLADVEGSTRLWETQPETMTAALASLNRTVNETVAAHDGVRPLEQGEGDSFVSAFARASDAVACALGSLGAASKSSASALVLSTASTWLAKAVAAARSPRLIAATARSSKSSIDASVTPIS